MARDVIALGEVAAKGAAMIDIRCGRCERHGRLSVRRLLASYAPDASIRDIMREQIDSCPHRDDTQVIYPLRPVGSDHAGLPPARLFLLLTTGRSDARAVVRRARSRLRRSVAEIWARQRH